MLLCGLRRGERIALRVKDIAFDVPCIRVNKSLEFPGNVGFEKGSKSKAGVRDVPIPDILLPYLKNQCNGKSNLVLSQEGKKDEFPHFF